MCMYTNGTRSHDVSALRVNRSYFIFYHVLRIEAVRQRRREPQSAHRGSRAHLYDFIRAWTSKGHPAHLANLRLLDYKKIAE